MKKIFNFVRCFFGGHVIEIDIMSMEAYAQEFMWCKHCLNMWYLPRSNKK